MYKGISQKQEAVQKNNKVWAEEASDKHEKIGYKNGRRGKYGEPVPIFEKPQRLNSLKLEPLMGPFSFLNLRNN